VARGTQHRKRRPRPNVRVAAATPRAHSRPVRPAWENQLFFGRLRAHFRWVFILLAAAFAISFVVLGVGSGSSGISQVFSSFFNGSSAGGPSLSSLQHQTTLHPKSATAWLNYANKLEEDQQDDNAISALTEYTKLRPKDQNELLELAGLYYTRASDWDTLWTDSQALQTALSPDLTLSPKSGTPLATALAKLPDDVATAVSTQIGATTGTEYDQVLTYLNDRVTVYQKLAALNPNDAVNQYSLAQAAQAAGSNSVALKAYEAFLKLAPNDSLASTARQQIASLKSSAG
jgi:hypothetical protein